MSKLTVFLFSVLLSSTFISCQKKESDGKEKIVENAPDSPYKIFFENLKLNNLTDTVLVQNRTKIFGCGMAAIEAAEDPAQKKVDQFYAKYGTVLDNENFLNLFEKNNKTKILWIERGNEGELFQLEDTILHKNAKLEQRLIAQKLFLTFDDEPATMDSVKIFMTGKISNREKSTLRTYYLSQQNKKWKIHRQTEENGASGF